MTTPVSTPGALRNFTHKDFPVFWSGCENRPPAKGAVKPGDVFPPEPTITGQDSTNADKLVALGYLPADPNDERWEYISGTFMVGDYNFSWSASEGKWIPGPG